LKSSLGGVCFVVLISQKGLVEVVGVWWIGGDVVHDLSMNIHGQADSNFNLLSASANRLRMSVASLSREDWGEDGAVPPLVLFLIWGRITKVYDVTARVIVATSVARPVNFFVILLRIGQVRSGDSGFLI